MGNAMDRRQTLLSAAALVIGNAFGLVRANAQSPSPAEARAKAEALSGQWKAPALLRAS